MRNSPLCQSSVCADATHTLFRVYPTGLELGLSQTCRLYGDSYRGAASCLLVDDLLPHFRLNNASCAMFPPYSMRSSSCKNCVTRDVTSCHFHLDGVPPPLGLRVQDFCRFGSVYGCASPSQAALEFAVVVARSRLRHSAPLGLGTVHVTVRVYGPVTTVRDPYRTRSSALAIRRPISRLTSVSRGRLRYGRTGLRTRTVHASRAIPYGTARPVSSASTAVNVYGRPRILDGAEPYAPFGGLGGRRGLPGRPGSRGWNTDIDGRPGVHCAAA
uniref:Uncharacterized protein n=1 Tax=Mycena chlorophos TaxID=658473 RepID=A0ABQ0LGR3_MYCCL|nr:predicted protein [Mycena chlorophos]